MSRPHPHLLEIAAWPWLSRLSLRAGRQVTLATVPADVWDGIARQGFDYLFLMGVWERSPLGRRIALEDAGLRGAYDRALPGWTDADVAGSPYCVSVYRPDARMGGWGGLDAARAALHRRGMQLIVDFVPNHTAFDHPWVSASPERYVHGTEEDLAAAPSDFRRVGGAILACGRDPHFPAWTDVAQLNHFNPDTREALVDALREIAAHADGVRCDMAMLLLNEVFERTWRRVLRDAWPAPAGEFWPAATAAVPSLLYMAEVYWDLEWTLQQQGFDYTYDKRLLDRLHEGAAPAVRDHLVAGIDFQRRLVRFLENHDEARSADSLRPRATASATTVATLPGMRFYFDGQIDGAAIRTPVQLGRWPEEPADPVLSRLYRRLLEVSGDRLFHEGDWNLLSVEPAGDGSFERLIAWRWRHHDRLAVVVVNVGDEAHGHVRLDELPPGDAWDLEDQLTGERYRWSRPALERTGLYVKLAPGGAHVFLLR